MMGHVPVQGIMVWTGPEEAPRRPKIEEECVCLQVWGGDFLSRYFFISLKGRRFGKPNPHHDGNKTFFMIIIVLPQCEERNKGQEKNVHHHELEYFNYGLALVVTVR